MRIMVQKFGGSSVRDTVRMLHAADIIRETRAAGFEVIAVVSAQGDTTDELVQKANAFGRAPDARELDALLATGEQASAALLAMALHASGVPALSLGAWQVPIESDGVHGGAEVKEIGRARVGAALGEGRVAVVAGFQGVCGGDFTTLGRGGSDTSAVALAAAFGAERCEIYTDVDGVYTADPRLCPAARRIPRLCCDQMLLLAREGAQVLHDRSAALARRERVPLTVCSCAPDRVGTRVEPEAPPLPVAGVARRLENGEAVLCAVGAALPSLPAERRALSALAAAGIDVLSVDGGEQCLRFRVGRERSSAALCALHGALFGTDE